jgi:hypothetical protein
MIPVLGREVEERQQRIAILGQAGDGVAVFGAVALGNIFFLGLGFVCNF